MDLINCSNCGREMRTDAIDCIYCGHPLKENTIFMNEEPIKQPVPNHNQTMQSLKCDEQEVLTNIQNIKKIAKVLKVFFIILLGFFALLTVFLLFSFLSYPDDEMIGMLIISLVATGIVGVIMYCLDTFIKWKAYMLQTNYYIYKNSNK